MPCCNKEFYLTIVRHGQTIANELKTIQGHSNTALTKLGLDQAKALANHFKTVCELRFDRSFSSDLSRAYDTCKIITTSCSKSANHNIVKDPRLRERKYGHLFEEKPIAQLLQEAFKQGFDETNFTQYTPDGVESMEELRDKVTEFCHKTLIRDCRDGEEVLLVSHWGTIKEILKLFQSKANGQIRGEHLKETPNAAFSRFLVRCKSLSSLNKETTLQHHQNGSDEGFVIDTIQVISLHQSPHLSNEQNSVNLKQQLK